MLLAVDVHLTANERRLYSAGRIVKFSQKPSTFEEHDLCAMEFPLSIRLGNDGPRFFDARRGDNAGR